MKLYSPSIRGFFDTDLPYKSIPDDALGNEVSDEQHMALLQGQALGQEIVPDEFGRPVLREVQRDLAAEARTARASLLGAADKMVSTIEDEGGDASAWRAYRVALRRLPEQSGFPTSIDWPPEPTRA